MLKRLIWIALVVGFIATSSAFPTTVENDSQKDSQQITRRLERFVRAMHVNTQIWDERTPPLLRITSIYRTDANVRIVHGCDFQPALPVSLSAGAMIEAVVIRSHQDWRVVSFNYIGACDMSTAASHN